MKPEDSRPIPSREEEQQIQLPPRPVLDPPSAPQAESAQRYPLRGTPLQYRDPTEPVVESDWGALK